MRELRVRAYLLGALLVWGVAGAGGAMAAGAPAVLIPSAVTHKALTEGTVSVIVELAVPFVPEPQLPNVLAVSRQKQGIQNAQATVLAALASGQHVVRRQYATVPLLALQVTPAALQTLAALPGVVTRVDEDRLLRPQRAQSVPLVQGPAAWTAGFDGTGQVIAIIDTGVDKTHAALTNKVVVEACFARGPSGLSGHCPNGLDTQVGAGAGVQCGFASEDCGHGTHVAGIAAGTGATPGVARGAQIAAVQVFSRFTGGDCDGGPSPCALAWDSDIIAGLEWVYQSRTTWSFAAVNLSLGGDTFTSACPNDPARPVIDNLRAAGIATVAASGNESTTNGLNSPACVPGAISVGSTGDGSSGAAVDQVSGFSNSASFLSLLAPGAWISSSVPGGGFATWQGTSMAVPHVAGAWAVLKQKLPTATVDQILTALQNTGLAVTDGRNGVVKRRIKINDALATLGGGGGGTTTGPPAIASPTPGTTLTSTTVAFTGGHTSGELQHWLYVGTTPGTSNLFSQDLGAGHTATVNGLPTGGIIHVRYWTRYASGWQVTDQTYTMNAPAGFNYTLGNAGGIAVVQGASGSTSVTASLAAGAPQGVSFVASGLPGGATAGFVAASCTPTCSTTLTVTTTAATPVGTFPIVVTGSPLGRTTTLNLAVSAASTVSAPPIVSPAPGATLTSGSVTFTGGHAAGDLQHWLYVGTTPGGYELFSQDLGSGHAAAVNGLPASGTIHVRYWTRFAGGWQVTDQTYTMSVVSGPAPITCPAAGVVLTSKTVTFMGGHSAGDLQHWLYVGTTPGGYELFTQDLGTGHMATVNGLPNTGTIHVRYWTRSSGGWQVVDRQYTMNVNASAPPRIICPAPGATLSGNMATFAGGHVPGTHLQHWLYVGTTPGGYELFSQDLGTGQHVSVGGLPGTGTIHVRYWTRFGSGWQVTDQTYPMAVGGSSAAAEP